MAFPTPVQGIGQTTSTELLAPVFTDLMSEAKKEPNIDKKREIYNQAYMVLRSNHLESALPTLLLTYVEETCYGKTPINDLDDDEWGMRRCARLLELSLTLQLHTIGLGTLTYDIQPFETLEELMESLGVEKNQKGKFYDTVRELRIDGDVLAQAAAKYNVRDVMAKTLTRLSCTYQNIDSMTQEGSYRFHKQMNDLTLKMIGFGTTEEKQAAVDFDYNRCRFLVLLVDPANIQAQVDSFNPVLKNVLTYFADAPLLRDSLVAQIKFSQGKLLTRLGADTLPLFEEAFALRQPLVGGFATEIENYDQEKLLCNIRTALIVCTLRKVPCTEASLQKAAMHAQALKDFLAKSSGRGDYNDYSKMYLDQILAVEKALAANNARLSVSSLHFQA